MSGQELEVVEQPGTTIAPLEDPAGFVAGYTRMANELAKVVRAKKLVVKIGQGEHARVEAWTMLGSMLGVFPVTIWTRPVKDAEGIHAGWEARVEAHTRDGGVVGAAEAQCLRGEKQWASRDDYALRSMAQCVPLRAEILTRNGWRRFDQVAVGERVLGYDLEADKTRWVPLEAVNVFGPSPVRRLRSRSFDVTCTAEHTWPVTAGEKGHTRSLVQTQHLRRGRSLIVAAPNSEGDEIPTALAAVIGWLLTDGTIRQPARGTVRMHIDQSKTSYVDEIRAALTAAHLSFSERISDVRDQVVVSGRTSTLLASHRFALTADSSRRLQELVGLSSKSDGPRIAGAIGPLARAAMLDAMLKADGTSRDGRRWRFGKMNRDVMDTFQILATLNGRALGHETGFELPNGNWMPTQTLRENRKVTVGALRIADRPDEPVWCPTTPLGTWVMRLDGTVCITGNTRATSKALRQPLGFVMVLSGFDATPAEEMPPPAPELATARFDPERKEGAFESPLITKPQQKRLFTIAGELGVKPDVVKELVRSIAGVESSSLVPRSKYDELIAAVEAEGIPFG